jgi:hypothetical protein
MTSRQLERHHNYPGCALSSLRTTVPDEMVVSYFGYRSVPPNNQTYSTYLTAAQVLYVDVVNSTVTPGLFRPSSGEHNYAQHRKANQSASPFRDLFFSAFPSWSSDISPSVYTEKLRSVNILFYIWCYIGHP